MNDILHRGRGAFAGVRPERSAIPLIAGGLIAVALLTTLVLRTDVPTILAITIAPTVGIVLLARPHLATFVVAFLLYTNIPAVAYQFHGIPRPIAALFIVLLGLPFIHYVVLRREPVRYDAVLVVMIAFMAAMVVSSFWAKGPEIAAGRIFSFAIEGILLYWLMLNVIRGYKTLGRVVVTVLLAGTLLGSLTIYQRVTRSYDQQFGGMAQRELRMMDQENRDAPGESPRMYVSDRAQGPVGGPNRYAQIMIVLLPLSVWMMRRGASRRERLFGLVTGAVILGAIMLSYSRGGYLGLAVMAAAAVMVRWIRLRTLVIAGVVLMVSMPIVAPTQYQRLTTVGEIGAIFKGRPSEAGGAIRGRSTEMLAALLVFLDHPVLGVGPGQYTPFYSLEYQQTPGIGFRELLVQRRAHSLYLELAAETGAVGLVIFLLAPWLALVQLWKLKWRWNRSRPEYADLSAAFFLSLVGYLATAVFLQLSYERYFWFLMALAGAAVLVIRSGRGAGHLNTDALGVGESAPFDAYSWEARV